MSLKLAVYSDFHFELTRFPWTPILSDDVDVLVVAGDVYEGDIARGIAWTAKAAGGRPSVFVPGNHEMWGRTLEDEIERGRETAAALGVTMLDSEGWIDVAGCLFCGGTLWTDLSLNVPAGQRVYGRHLGEQIDVRGAGIDRRAKPADAVRWHRRTASAIERALAEPRDGRPRVVVTHHAPSALSLRAAFRNDPRGPSPRRPSTTFSRRARTSGSTATCTIRSTSCARAAPASCATRSATTAPIPASTMRRSLN